MLPCLKTGVFETLDEGHKFTKKDTDKGYGYNVWFILMDPHEKKSGNENDLYIFNLTGFYNYDFSTPPGVTVGRRKHTTITIQPVLTVDISIKDISI